MDAQCGVAATSSSSAPSSPPVGAVAPLLAACAAAERRRRGLGAPAPAAAGALRATSAGALSGPITVLAEGGDPGAEPALQKVYDDFKAQNPAVEWDIRAIPGLGPDWDRLARAALESGEPVGLVMLDGLFVRAWTRDGLLADLGADPEAGRRARPSAGPVPSRRASEEATTRAFPLALSQGRPDHGPVLQQGAARPGGPRASEDDRRPQGDGEATGGARRGTARPSAPVTSPSIRCSSCGCCR